MKNYSIFGVLTLLFFACNPSDNTDREIVEDEVITKTNTVVEEVVEEKTLYFEDYLAFDTKADLVDHFGVENLVDDTTWYAEGTEMYLRSTLTTPEGQKIKFLWSREFVDELSFIEANHTLYTSDWDLEGEQQIYTKDGLYLGMPLLELRDWNEADFQFMGFGWDYEGGIFGDEENKISRLPYSIRLSMSNDNYEEEYMGDINFSTEGVSEDNGIRIESFTMGVE